MKTKISTEKEIDCVDDNRGALQAFLKENPEFKKRQEETEDRLKALDDVSKDIPSLL